MDELFLGLAALAIVPLLLVTLTRRRRPPIDERGPGVDPALTAAIDASSCDPTLYGRC